MKKISFYIGFSLILFLPFACSKKEEWKGEIEYVTGIKIVKNYSKGLWEENKKAERVFFKEELSIGSAEGSENKIFYQPMDVIADDDGNVYVLDSRNNRIQKFDKFGNYLLTIGSKGQGPGEILNSEDIELDSKGNILVFDYRNNRITKFDPKGNLIDTFNFKFFPFRGVLDSKDNIYIFSRNDGKLIHKFNSNGQYLFSFMDEIKNENKRVESYQNLLGRIAITKDDKIFLGLAYPYNIYIYNTEGKLLEKILTPTSYAQPVYITSATDIPPDSEITNFLISGMAISPQGYIFCRNISFEIPSKLNSFEIIQEIIGSLFKKYSYLDIFDPEGRFLIHQHAPNLSWGGYFDNKGYYYGIEEAEDYFKAVEYSIKFK